MNELRCALLLFTVARASASCAWYKDDPSLKCTVTPTGTTAREWIALGVQCGCTWSNVCSNDHPLDPDYNDVTLFDSAGDTELADLCKENTPCNEGPSVCIDDLDDVFSTLILVWILIPLLCLSTIVGLLICAYVGVCCWAVHQPVVHF